MMVQRMNLSKVIFCSSMSVDCLLSLGEDLMGNVAEWSVKSLFLLSGLSAQFSLVALATKRLVLRGFAEQHALLGIHDTMTHIGQTAAAYTDGMHLGHLVGHSQKSGYRAEGHALEVHIKPGDDDAHATVGQFVADIYQSFIEKLRLIDAHDIIVGRQKKDAGRRVNRSGRNGIAIVAHHIGFRIAHINGRLEYLHRLAGKFGTAHAAYQLFGLARKHRATYHFYPSRAMHLTH